jgi:hypothetical protein
MKTWLFSLHRGPDNSQFFSNVHNGQQWSADVPVQQTGGISNTPAAVEFNSNMNTFYERDHVFYYNTYDGEVWTGEAPVPNTAGVNAGIAAAFFNQKVYLFYSNPNQSTLMYRTFDGTAFGAETAVTDHYSNLDTPAAAVLDNILYVFCRGQGPNEPGNTNRFWYAAYDGRLWHDGNVGNTGGIGNGPGATAYDGKIYLMFNSPSGQFCYKTYDGSHWLADTQIPDTPGCIGNPGAAVFDQKMYVLHQAPGSRFLYRTYDGEDWTSETAVPNTAGISAGPAALAFSL